MAKFYMIINSAARPGRSEEYSEWCSRQHFPDLLRVPGIVAAKRFKALPGAPGEPVRFMAIFGLNCNDPDEVLQEIGRRNGTPDMPRSDSYDRESVQIILTEIEGEWGTMF
jgi:hypothetical protein